MKYPINKESGIGIGELGGGQLPQARNLVLYCGWCVTGIAGSSSRVRPETLYHRDDALLYIAYVMLIWTAPIPADMWHCSLWP